jgi:hypothetical protein
MAMPNEASEMKLYPGPLSYERELSLLIRSSSLVNMCMGFFHQWLGGFEEYFLGLFPYADQANSPAELYWVTVNLFSSG